MRGNAVKNTVCITNGIVNGENFLDSVYGGHAENGSAKENSLTLDNVTVSQSVIGGFVACNGDASENTVTINGGKIDGGVLGGFVGFGNSAAINNTVIISGSPEFSNRTVLCRGICFYTFKYDAFACNTLKIIGTKGIIVNVIDNFENYEFYLPVDIRPGEIILTSLSGAPGGGREELADRNICLYTESVIDKDDCYTLINSIPGFSGVEKASFTYDNEGLVKYKWDLVLTHNGQDLTVILTGKELREEKAKPLLEGYGAGACTNNGMDYIISKIEKTESLLGEREGEIGAFYGLAANKSRYKTGSHIRDGWDIDYERSCESSGSRREELTAGAFVEYGSGDSEINCGKKSKGTSKYVGGGVLGRYNLREDYVKMSLGGQRYIVESVLRGGGVRNSFKGKDAKGKEYKYDDVDAMYGGCEAGGGYKHKVSEKIGMDWSLRYMFGYQGGSGKDVNLNDSYDNKVNFEGVISNRIRVGVRGKYIGIGKANPYVGIE